MAKSRWTVAWEARTLRDAHAALGNLRPRYSETDPQVWWDFYRQSAAIYREVAQVDRFHFHEANDWANAEQKRADKWEVTLREQASQATQVTE